MPHKFQVVEYDAAFPAIVAILSGVIYFLRYHTVKTVVVLLVMLSGPVFLVWNYVTKEQVKIESLSPLEANGGHGSNFSLIDRAYAENLGGNPIYINGKLWGYSDPSFQIWKVYGKPSIIIYDSTSRAVFGAEIPILADKSRMMQYQQFK